MAWRVRIARRYQKRTRSLFARRPYLIDVEDLEFADDLELHDWMFGTSEGKPQ